VIKMCQIDANKLSDVYRHDLYETTFKKLENDMISVIMLDGQEKHWKGCRG
jgi:hypothetical protein